MSNETITPELEAINKVAEQIKGYEAKLGTKLDKAELEKVTTQLEELKKGQTDPEVIKAIKDSLQKFQTQLEEMQEDISTGKNKGVAMIGKSFGQVFVDALKESKILDKANWGKSEHRGFEMKFDMAAIVNKVAGTMTTSNVTAVGTNAIPFTLADYEMGLTRIVRRKPWILTIANVSSTDKKYVQWAEQANPDGSATYTAEGVAKNQIDFDWVEKSKEVLKITAFIKVSKEALDDIDSLRSEIDTELMEQILLKVDDQLLNGAGTAGILAGIIAGDTAYSAGSFAGTIPSANKSDVLRTAIAQVIANQFVPDYALLHPNDIAAMELEKGEDGHYVMPPFRSADGTLISGVRVLGNTGQTVDKFTVGDFSKLNVKIREDIGIDIGLDQDDFTKNLRTILGEMRLVSYIKTNHAGAFVSGDFSDAIAALDSGS